jgi:two-component system, cell cycle response regulator
LLKRDGTGPIILTALFRVARSTGIGNLSVTGETPRKCDWEEIDTMTATSCNGKDPIFKIETKAIGQLLGENKEALRFIAKDSTNKQVTVVIICDGPEPFDEKTLGATPHVAMHMEDDLLQKIKELHEENAKLRSLSLIDSLTGLGNKRFFWMQLETEMARTRRTGHSCALTMIDLDNFKCLNDIFGHLEGDKFLSDFARALRNNSRSTDLPCRYGGDEFAVIMPVTSLMDAFKTGDRLKSLLADMPQKSDPAISLSIGIAEYAASSTYGPHEFVRAADRALYEAKEGGKNRICIDRTWKGIAIEDNEVNQDERDALFIDHE